MRESLAAPQTTGLTELHDRLGSRDKVYKASARPQATNESSSGRDPGGSRAAPSALVVGAAAAPHGRPGAVHGPLHDLRELEKGVVDLEGEGHSLVVEAADDLARPLHQPRGGVWDRLAGAREPPGEGLEGREELVEVRVDQLLAPEEGLPELRQLHRREGHRGLAEGEDVLVEGTEVAVLRILRAHELELLRKLRRLLPEAGAVAALEPLQAPELAAEGAEGPQHGAPVFESGVHGVGNVKLECRKLLLVGDALSSAPRGRLVLEEGDALLDAGEEVINAAVQTLDLVREELGLRLEPLDVRDGGGRGPPPRDVLLVILLCLRPLRLLRVRCVRVGGLFR